MNEEGRIGNVVRSVKSAFPQADVAVVDDASTDKSATEACDAGALVLSHGCNLGYGAALETGYLYAVRSGYDILLQMDGDGQHLADQLAVLLPPIQSRSADIVIGSRYLGGSARESTTRIRRIGHRLFACILFLLTRLRVTDPTSGFQGLNRSALALFSSGVFPCDYPDSDVVLMAWMSGLRIQEVPVKMMGRVGGKSMHSGIEPLYYGVKMILSMFIVLLNFRLWRQWRSRERTERSGSCR